MNEIIVIVALGFLGVFALIGLVMLVALSCIAGSASVRGFKHKKSVYADITNEYNQKLAEHRRENQMLLLEKECAIDDEITARKLEKYNKKKNKRTEEEAPAEPVRRNKGNLRK